MDAPTCHGPMRWRGTGTRWEGEYEVDTIRYACTTCPSRAEVCTWKYVGEAA